MQKELPRIGRLAGVGEKLGNSGWQGAGATGFVTLTEKVLSLRGN